MIRCQMPRTQRSIDAIRSLPCRSSESKALYCDFKSMTETGGCQLAEPFCLINVSSVVDALLLNAPPLLHVLPHASVQPFLCPLSTKKYRHHPKVESYFIWWESLGIRPGDGVSVTEKTPSSSAITLGVAASAGSQFGDRRQPCG